MQRWWLTGILLLVFVVGVLPAAAQDEEDERTQEERAADVLDYINSARQDVSIACYRVDQPSLGVFARADEPFPLASTIKIMILGVYAQGAASGRFDPTERVPLNDLDAYYLPRTDGGAHPEFLEWVTPDFNNTVSLLDVVYGMIRFSSNAATDFLHARMTDADFEAFYALMGIEDTELPISLLGLFLAQDNHETGISDASMARDELRASAHDWQEKYVTDATWRARERAYHQNNSRRYLAEGLQLLPTQAEFFAKYDTRGTAEDFARVMAVLQRGDTLSATAGSVMRAVLSWPMQFQANRDRFFTIGLKGGSLPGIVTGVYFAQPKGGQPLVLAVFYRDLPTERYTSWLRGFDQQDLEFLTLVNGCGMLTLPLESG